MNGLSMVSISEKPAPGDGQHILVIAGDPEIAELLSTTLELAGYLVVVAGSGTEALTRLGASASTWWCST